MTAVLIGVSIALIAMVLRQGFMSFWAQPLAAYDGGTAAPFDLKSDLNGPLKCDGIIYGPMGRVVSRFNADMEMTWDGDEGVLNETFTYDTGNTQDRTWRLRVGADGMISGSASDFVGPLMGQQRGDAVGLRYRIALPKEAGGHVLTVRDWMYKTPNGVIMNRSEMRKFGIKVAELVAVIRPAPDA